MLAGFVLLPGQFLHRHWKERVTAKGSHAAHELLSGLCGSPLQLHTNKTLSKTLLGSLYYLAIHIA